MPSKLRQIALDAKDIRREPITVPHWPEFVGAEARSLSLKARNAAIKRAQVENADGEKEVDSTLLVAVMVAAAVFDTDGHQVFEESDIEALAEKNADAIDHLWKPVARLNGLEDVAGNAEKN